MPMPTTRRGRYLHYRAKLKRRMAVIDKRHRGTAVGCRGKTTRQRVWQGFPKQSISTLVGDQWPEEFWVWDEDVPRLVKPTYSVWGVMPDPFWPDLTTKPPGNMRYAIVGYQLRRLTKLPPISSLPWGPWRFTHAELLPTDYCPKVRYPSGALTYRYRNFPETL